MSHESFLQGCQEAALAPEIKKCKGPSGPRKYFGSHPFLLDYTLLGTCKMLLLDRSVLLYTVTSTVFRWKCFYLMRTKLRMTVMGRQALICSSRKTENKEKDIIYIFPGPYELPWPRGNHPGHPPYRQSSPT